MNTLYLLADTLTNKNTPAHWIPQGYFQWFFLCLWFLIWAGIFYDLATKKELSIREFLKEFGFTSLSFVGWTFLFVRTGTFDNLWDL